MSTRFLTLATAGALSLVAGMAHAVPTITYTNFVSNDQPQLNPTVTVSQTSPGMFDIVLEMLPTGEEGFLTGFFLGTKGDVACSDVTISGLGDGSCADSAQLGGNANLNGLLNDYSVFDFAIEYPKQGNANRLESSEFGSTVLSISDTSLAIGDFEQIGLRFQGVMFQSTNDNEGSDKLVGSPGEPFDPEFPGVGAEIPLPAAGWLMIAGIGGLAAMRRRKT